MEKRINYIPDVKFLMILIVVMAHCALSDVMEGMGEEQPLYIRIVDIPAVLSKMVIVPAFFILSAYLFFRGGFSIESWVGKMRRRVRTLLIPYIFWNVLCMGLLFIKHYWLGMPDYGVFGGGTEGLWQMIKGFWDLGDTGYPYAFAFWYLRNLMVYILLAPLAKILATDSRVTILFFLSYIIIDYDTYGFQWFVAGAWLALHNYELKIPGKIWLGVILVATNGISILMYYFIGNSILYNIASIIGVYGIYVVCMGYGKWMEQYNGNKIVGTLVGSTFMIYAVHQCFCTKVREIWIGLLNVHNFGGAFAAYVLTFVTLVMSGVVSYIIMKRMAPRVLSVITGGR